MQTSGSNPRLAEIVANLLPTRPGPEQVEGVEFALLGRLARRGLLCDVDRWLVEWHGDGSSSAPGAPGQPPQHPRTGGGAGAAPPMDRAQVEAAVRACNGTASMLAMDDEYHGGDGLPWPSGSVCNTTAPAMDLASIEKALIRKVQG